MATPKVIKVASQGPAGASGSDASVTNANVNTAIEASPSASRTSLGLGDSATQDAADLAVSDAARAAIDERRPLGTKIAFLGDSITAQTWTTAATTGSWQGWVGIADAMLGGAVERVAGSGGVHFATSGYTLQQMIDNWLDEVVASGAHACVVHGGTNGSSETSAEKYADWLTIIAALQAAGIRPVATTVLPFGYSYGSGHRTATLEFNQLVRAYCQANGILLCDWHASILDHSTGYLDTDFSADEVHPNITGGWRLGRLMRDTLEQITQPGARLPDLGSANWLSTNPYMTGDSSGKATSWTLSNTASGTTTPTKVARTDGMPGEWQQIVLAGGGTASDGFSFNPAISGYAEGDVLHGVVEVEFDSSGWAGYSFGTRLVVQDSGGSRERYGPYIGGSSELSALATTMDLPVAADGRMCVFRTPPITVGASPTNVFFWVYMRGAGTIRISRCGVIKE